MGYLIKDTTKEERQQNVNDALSLTMLGGLGEPSEEVKKLAEAYVNEEIEAEEMQDIIMKRYINLSEIPVT